MVVSLESLKANWAEILALAEKYGASNIRIFGSVARGEAQADSDVDFLIDLEPGRSLLDHIGFKQELEDLLGRSVDVAESVTLHDLIRDQVLRDAIAL
ncbi:nucleotidyltransferase family protein [Nodosilinea sp. LEGE 07088]|uniref:nucleotidyltransferase family protein n=1 Tax=Nodosilinea sp. LEGE 07088 TaxID=2777968 RepID=UPI00188183AD|nr:nucleotidyltransferase family protein [Nodosilinea sp. LEGE 07088]MBE9140501.1 nucleotidyltransferase family protein [Nodosilinea sp. LEGE 07088]